MSRPSVSMVLAKCGTIFSVVGMALYLNMSEKSSCSKFAGKHCEVSENFKYVAPKHSLLLMTSEHNLRAFESNNPPPIYIMRTVLENTIDKFLTPTSEEQLSSGNLVTLHTRGRGRRPMVMASEDYNEVRQNWYNLLAAAGVGECVKRYNPTVDSEVLAKVYGDCLRAYEDFNEATDDNNA